MVFRNKKRCQRYLYTLFSDVYVSTCFGCLSKIQNMEVVLARFRFCHYTDIQSNKHFIILISTRLIGYADITTTFTYDCDDCSINPEKHF
jgi:hypothetical protein